MVTFFLPLTLFIAFLLRLPSLFEPNWYGDEGIYQVIGQAMRAGRTLYTGIWDNKPPLLYVIYSLFNGDQFSVRFLSLLFMLVSIVSFYFLSKKLFKTTPVIYGVSGLFALLFAMPLLEGNIANAENFMLLPIMLAMLFGLQQYFFSSGLLLSFAFLIKIVAIFDLGALLVFLFVTSFPKKMKGWIRNNLSIGIGFLIPIALTVVFFLLQGAFTDFLTATFSQNVTYVGVQELLFIKLFLLGFFSLIVFWLRNKLSKAYVFIYLWLAFSLFNALFGGRPWTHYLLTLLPAFCLFLGMLVEDKKLRLVNMALLGVLLLLIYKNFWMYGKTIPYYANFVGKLAGQKTAQEYRGFFDWFVNRDYEVASYIRANSQKSDTIFIWGDNAQIYALSERLPVWRYTVSYHVTFYPNAVLETKEAIERYKPIFIIAVREDFPRVLLPLSYELKNEIKGVKVYARRI